MGKRVADQHAVMDRGWHVAEELANAVYDALTGPPLDAIDLASLHEALRRYEEARNGE